jgi:2-dehydro-3-deoxyphosphogluconate aldolase/(4S)-4-hydroxy-2-oxoglutarate aldolase
MQKKRFEIPSNKVIYSQTIDYIEKERTFLLFKANHLDSFIEWSAYATEKGFNLIGVDINTPGLKDHLKSQRKRGQRTCGIFNVSSKKEARISINSGASFIFCTHCDRGIIRRCNRETIFNSIGCLTPTEVAAANEFGARTISVFPCNKLGGASWFVFLRQIFPKLRLIPTDKMTPSEAGQYLTEGAYAVAPIIDLDLAEDSRGLIADFKIIS